MTYTPSNINPSISEEQLAKFKQLLAYSMLSNDSTAAQVQNVKRQMMQALAKGVLDSDELYSLTEGAPFESELIADYLNITDPEELKGHEQDATIVVHALLNYESEIRQHWDAYIRTLTE